MSVTVESNPSLEKVGQEASAPLRQLSGRVAYLVNQYPVPSGTFIRREIDAMERHGVEVMRYAIRQTKVRLSEPKDLVEASKTRVILDLGLFGLLAGVIYTILSKPIKFAKAALLTLRIGWHSDRGLICNLAYLMEACQLARWLRNEDVQHVHAHFATNPASVAMLCQVLGGPPFSFTLHGPHEFDKPEFIRLGEKIKRSKFAVAISEYGRSQMFRWVDHKDWKKIHVIHCGCDAAYISAEITPPPVEPRLLFIGRLAEQKGTHLLIDAANLLKEEGLDFELTMVGDGPMRGELEILIREYGLQDNVRLAGWQDDVAVRESLLESRALVLSSFAEGLPVVIMESLALGRPVVSTNIAGVAELVEPGVCGWLVPAGSADALAQKMKEVLEMPVDGLAEYGRRGAERVREQHNAITEAGKLADLIGLKTKNS